MREFTMKFTITQILGDGREELLKNIEKIIMNQRS